MNDIENVWKVLQTEKVQGEDISARLAYPELSKNI